MEKENNEKLDFSQDNTNYYCSTKEENINNQSNKKIEILNILDAQKKYDWVKNYINTLVKRSDDEIKKENIKAGYFIRVPKNVKIEESIKTCFLVEDKKEQRVHNLIILEENSQLHILNGCIAQRKSKFNSHFGITEIFVGKNSNLSYTMIHDWEEETQVFPRTAVKVNQGGNFISNYVCLKPVKYIKSNPLVEVFKNGKAQLNSIVYSYENSVQDLGGKIILKGENSNAMITSRVISKGGVVNSPNEIKIDSKNSKGFMECHGLLLNNLGNITAIPKISNCEPSSTLSHEASVGDINEESILYLMSRGYDREESKQLIINGFLDKKINGIPNSIQRLINYLIKKVN